LNSKYIHTKELHNEASPNEIVPILNSLFAPSSVVDVGCGTGTFLAAFKRSGIQVIKGYDGSWVNMDLLKDNLDESEFVPCDLEQNITFNQRYDLALCLEVAEHLSEQSADTLVQNLVASSDVVVFSAAIPGQGGQNHINEQWLSYWQGKFERYGYIVEDVLKPLLWNNEKIEYWYKQNMVVARTPDYSYNKPIVENTLKNMVHSDLLKERTAAYNDLKEGRGQPKMYENG